MPKAKPLWKNQHRHIECEDRLVDRRRSVELIELSARKRTLRDNCRRTGLAAEVAQLRRLVFALVREMKTLRGQ